MSFNLLSNASSGRFIKLNMLENTLNNLKTKNMAIMRLNNNNDLFFLHTLWLQFNGNEIYVLISLCACLNLLRDKHHQNSSVYHHRCSVYHQRCSVYHHRCSVCKRAGLMRSNPSWSKSISGLIVFR